MAAMFVAAIILALLPYTGELPRLGGPPRCGSPAVEVSRSRDDLEGYKGVGLIGAADERSRCRSGAIRRLVFAGGLGLFGVALALLVRREQRTDTAP